MLAKFAALSLATLFSGHLLAAECSKTVDSTDSMTFDTKDIQVPKSCKAFTIKLTHSGTLPKAVMGHNWVLSKEADAQAIVSDGMAANLDNNYIKEGDSRVLAHTKVIGAGETDAVTFDVAKLDPAEKYVFFCSFPGHISMMKGSITLVD